MKRKKKWVGEAKTKELVIRVGSKANKLKGKDVVTGSGKPKEFSKSLWE